MKNELIKNLQEAYDLLASIPVQGRNVDVMYIARTKLRSAYQLAEKQPEAEGQADD